MSFNRISLRIAIWYAGAFLAGSLLLFALIGYFLASSLKLKDRELLEAKFVDYSAIAQRDGVTGLRTRASSVEIPDAARYLVRLSDPSGKTLFLHPPAVPASEINAPTIDFIENFLSQRGDSGPWLTIPGKDYGDEIEILSRKLSSGLLLQVGKDIEDREDFMKGYARAFFSAFVPIVLLAILVGILLSNRILAPIRWLTSTVKQIRSGEGSARVPLRKNGDDFDELGVLFNQMLDENGRLVRAMKETLDHVAHDLRTPLMHLQNSAESAIQKATTVDDCKEALADCRESSDIIQRMLSAIMDISEAEAGTLHLNRERVSATSIIEQAISLYGFVAEEKDINLVTEVTTPIDIEADGPRLLQALANLLDNAIKYSPEHSSVTVSLQKEGKDAVFRVTDQGAGISEEDLPKIWTRLYRGDSSRSTRGMGLGLNLVRAIALAHRGNANASRNHDRGCTFQLVVPIAKS